MLFSSFVGLCGGAVCLMYVEATRFPIQRRREAVVARPSSFRESQDMATKPCWEIQIVSMKSGCSFELLTDLSCSFC